MRTTNNSTVLTKVAKSMVALFLLYSASSYSDEWIKCANEDGYCDFSGTKKVRYGADERWHYLTISNGTSCNNTVFGDSAYGVKKGCYYYQVSSTYWEFCAKEGGYCKFTGRQKIKFGANGEFFYRTLEDGAYCNNEVFGDPIYGTKKDCYILKTAFQ